MGQFEEFKGKPLGGLEMATGTAKTKVVLVTTNANTAPTTVDAPEVPNKEYFEFIVKTTKKTVRQEDALIRQILYTGFSADTSRPY